MFKLQQTVFKFKLFTSKYYFSVNQNILKSSAIPNQKIDLPEIINQKIKKLSQLIKKSKYPIFFTGAGISTSLGIPDYRSGQNTIIKTGPGLWNRSQQQMKLINTKRKVQNTVDLVIPSLTHMSIRTLIQKNIFKHLVSQNTDGLHLRSGIKKKYLSQLHGNRNLQFCIKCQKKYLRDFRTLKNQDKHFKPGQKRDHFTGRHCQNCKGQLHDSIVYFGEKLPKEQLMKAFNQGARSDLCIVIGSSLTVKPSSNVPLMPLQYNSQGKLVIINIQQTPLDPHAQLKINGFCDQIFEKLMNQLKLNIIPYSIQRFLSIIIQRKYNSIQIQLKSIDQHHYNFSYIKNAKLIIKNIQIEQMNNNNIQNNNKDSNIPQQLKSNFNFIINDQDHLINNLQQYIISIQFFGSLLPNLNINLSELFNQNQVYNLIGKQEINLKIILEQQHLSNWKTQKININI